MSTPFGVSSPDQCRGYRVGVPCTAEPRFKLTYGNKVDWACGHHVAPSLLWLSDEWAAAAAISVQVRW